jgi:hypothetical protein
METLVCIRFLEDRFINVFSMMYAIAVDTFVAVPKAQIRIREDQTCFIDEEEEQNDNSLSFKDRVTFQISGPTKQKAAFSGVYYGQ